MQVNKKTKVMSDMELACTKKNIVNQTLETAKGYKSRSKRYQKWDEGLLVNITLSYLVICLLPVPKTP